MKTAIKIQEREGEFGNVWELANGSQIEQTLELNHRDCFGLATETSRLVTYSYDVTIETTSISFLVADYGTAAKAKAAAYRYAKSWGWNREHATVYAKDLKRGDFIVCCERWPNGREVLGVYRDCGIEIMFKTCGDDEYHHETLDSKTTKITISRAFSDRFKR
jgi:hypothetical protein